MGCSGRERLGGAFGLVLLLYSTCLILPVGGDRLQYFRADNFCAQLGHQYGKGRGKEGTFTIGGELNQMIDAVPWGVVAVNWVVVQLFGPKQYWIEGQANNQLTCRSTPKKGYDYIWKHAAYAYVDFCPKDMEIRAYLVKQHGRILKGWLHFEVEFTEDSTDTMEYVLIQVRDENQNIIGEFVTAEDEQCKAINSKHPLVSPSKYQVLPCSAIPTREPKVSNSLVMANPEAMVHGNELKVKYPDRFFLYPKSTLKIGKGVHFNWRLNEYWCNRHLRFRLEANVWSKKSRDNWNKGTVTVSDNKMSNDHELDHKFEHCRNYNRDCLIKRKTTAFWIYPNWFGAADIKLPGPLNCSTLAIDYESKDGTVTEEAKSSWINGSSELKYADDILGPDFKLPHHYLTPGCQVDPWPKYYATDLSTVVSFGGRCNETSEKNPTSANFHNCEKVTRNNREFKHVTRDFTSYTDYSQNLEDSRFGQCQQTCEEPNISNPDHLKEIKSYPRGNKSEMSKNRKPRIVFTTLVNSRHKIRADTFWQTRKFHGSLCIVLVLFLIPISNFFIRYYKETFMHSRGLGCAPWFWFHLFVCFAVPVLLWCGYSAMTQNILHFGRSTSGEAVFHRVLGRIFVTGFILMTCLGGLRPVQTHLRLVFMALHSVVGFFLYILGIFLILNSTRIPSSPSLDNCDDGTGLPTGVSFTAIMTFAWLGIDLLFHALLTILQFVVDRRYEIKRAGFGLPFVPILPAISPYSRADLVGSRFRKVVLLLYVILAATITYLTIAELFGKDRIEKCNLGNMTCDLSETRPNMASSPFGCSAFDLKYYASVYDKYNFEGKDVTIT